MAPPPGSGGDFDQGETVIKNAVLVLPCLLACGLAVPAMAAEIRMQSPVPFSESSIIADNVKAECRLDARLAEFVSQHAAMFGNQILLTAEAPDTAEGAVLQMEIVDAQSSGNAFTGHHKVTSVRGVLFKDGTRVGGFTARRISRGGFGGGFKGSCSVLGRTIDVIGEDVGQWLAAPVDGAKLGDL
ncbi:hypothetical protein [Pseudoxanthomonas sp.]|uniref:hypothetical protein n=1 Tax=Pseudoxanthomonas sp. TaxID=1871049 RepID=UPI00258DBEE9|nr:hypothetical protein [Pseudoxanthomonas sp.]MCR6686354.1 hypothetical protein [Pseudoxanthomonas sp.]